MKKTNIQFSQIKKILLASALMPGVLIGVSGCRQDKPPATDLRIKQLDPEQAVQMAKSIESLVQPELAEGLIMNVWGVDSLIADPISIQVDNQGRLFYARTNRQKNSEFDIRGHQDWEIESIKLQTVEDKRAFLRKELAPENSHRNEWLADLNGDGSHDWRDMTVEKEHIYTVEDTNGDGVADMYQLVVEDFHEEVTDVAGAVLSHENDIYVGVAPDLWKLTDTNGDGLVDEKVSLAHGFGIHIGFGAHGMSGLRMGPDGRIYWGIGDIGFNGEVNGEKWEYPNRGVIARANPDGSDFEIFAMGVRNTHEFVFDEYGNLISVDNDGDHPGEYERLVYLVNGSDTGWRINWQFGKYRDLDNNTYKVWMDEQYFKPRFPGQAAFITPPIANYISGPTGMAYNPGTALGPQYKNTFFVVEFVGSPARSGIHAFKLKPKGATFELGETNKIMSGVLATGIDFGPDGAMYIADWIDGWGMKGYGRVWKMDVAGEAENAERKQTQALLAEDFTQRPLNDLLTLIQNQDMRVRQKAQFELVKRGGEGAEVLKQAISQTQNQLGRIHGIWGMSQLARKDAKYAQNLMPLLNDGDPEIRAQAAKWLGDMRYKEAGNALIPLLKDENSRARFFAAEALGRIAFEPAINPIINMLIDNNDEDAYLRHAGSLALARIGKADPVVALHNHPSTALRLAAVVSLRRLRHPGIAKFLNDQDELVVTEAARAINDDFSIEGALPALGEILETTPFKNEPLIRRAINANFRVANDKSMQILLNYASNEKNPVAMRAETIEALSTWAKPSVVDRVDGRYRGLPERDASQLKKLASDKFIALTSHSNKDIRISAIIAISKLQIKEGAPRLFAMLKADKEPEIREAALRALAAINYENMGQAIEQALSDREKKVRVVGLDLAGTIDIDKALTVNLLANVIETKTTEEKQAALVTLGSLPLENTQPVLERLINRMEKGNLPPEIHLELTEAVKASNSTDLNARIDEVRAKLSPETIDAAYYDAMYGGDPARGGNLAFRHQTAQCIRCHSYNDFGGNAGPRLNAIGAKLSRQELLEALIDPSKRLAPGYGFVTLELNNGKTFSGVLQEENAQSLSIKVGSKADTVIRQGDIAKKNYAPSSMPNMKDLLTKREIRDLVGFLASLKEDEMMVRKVEDDGHGE